jgi:hypothetical protein
MGYLDSIQGVVYVRKVGLTCGVKPHYKLGKLNSNFVLKFLFNAWAKKLAAEWVSLMS